MSTDDPTSRIFSNCLPSLAALYPSGKSCSLLSLASLPPQKLGEEEQERKKGHSDLFTHVDVPRLVDFVPETHPFGLAERPEDSMTSRPGGFGLEELVDVNSMHIGETCGEKRFAANYSACMSPRPIAMSSTVSLCADQTPTYNKNEQKRFVPSSSKRVLFSPM